MWRLDTTIHTQKGVIKSTKPHIDDGHFVKSAYRYPMHAY